MVFLIFCKFAAAFEEPMLTANPRSSFGIAGSSINQRRDKKKKKRKEKFKESLLLAGIYTLFGTHVQFE